MMKKQKYLLDFNNAFDLLFRPQIDLPLKSNPDFSKIYDRITKQKSNSQIRPFAPLTIKFKFKEVFGRFDTYQKRQFVCKKQLGSISNHTKQRAFVCYDCREEEDSVICEQCFEKEKHEGHNSEQLYVQNRGCGCGDPSFLKQNGFCSKHSKQKVKSFSTQDENYFQEIFTKCMHFILILYLAYKIRAKILLDQHLMFQSQDFNTRMFSQEMDGFISYFFEKLVDLNKYHQRFNQLTIKCLQTEYPLTQEQAQYLKQKNRASLPIKQLCLIFNNQLNTTLRCFNLYSLLFVKDKKFKKDITALYIKMASQDSMFYETYYHKLSRQLLNSSQNIQQHVQTNQIEILSFTPPRYPWSRQKNLRWYQMQKYLKKFYQNYLLLSKLKPQAFKLFWRYFSQKDGFNQLTNVFQALTKDKYQMQISHRRLFYLQEYPIILCLKVIQQTNHQQKDRFIIHNLKEIAKSLFQKTCLDQMAKEDNFFLTKLRMWTAFLFAYFFKCKQLISPNQINKQEIQTLIQHLNIPEEYFQKSLCRIFQILITRLYSLSCRVCQKKQFQSLQKTYFKSKLSHNNLMRLDLFMIKFIIIYFEAYKPNHQDKVSQILKAEYLLSFRQFEKINEQLNNQSKQRQKLIIKLEQKIRSMSLFVGLINQVIISDINQFCLYSLIRDKKEIIKGRLLQNYKSLYKRVLNSIQSPQPIINYSTFRQVFHSLFFKDEELQLQCIDVNNFFVREKQNQPFNFDQFYSLRFKIQQLHSPNRFVKTRKFNLHHIQSSQYGQNVMVKAYYQEIFQQLVVICSKIPQFKGSIMKDLQLQACIFQSLYGLRLSNPQLLSKIQLLLAKGQQTNISDQSSKTISSIFSSDYSSSLEETSQTSEIVTHPIRIKKRMLCVLQDKCNNKNDIDFAILSYAFYTNAHGAFGIDPEQRIVSFDTCGHYCHLKCQRELIYKQNCPKCNSRWNIIFPCQPNTKTEVQFARLDTIQIDKKSFKFQDSQLFKSIVFYLTRFLAIDEINFFEKSVEFYRYLCKTLKFMISPKALVPYKLAQNASEQQYEINKAITHLLLKKLVPQNKQQQMKQNPRIQVISKVINFLQSDQKKLHVPNPKQYIKGEKILEEKWRILLPQRLSQLFEGAYQCRICHKMGEFSYKVCMLPHKDEKQNQKWSICQNQSCQKKCIVNHIKQHHINDGIWIETHTGSIIYHRMYTYIFGQYRTASLYTKSNSHIPYELEKGYNKKDFYLNNQLVATELNRIHSCSFQLKATTQQK